MNRFASRIANPMRGPVRRPLATLPSATLPPTARDHESDGMGAIR